MVAPMMIIRRLVRIYCENNNMIESLNEKRFKNVCNFLYEKYVKQYLTTQFNHAIVKKTEVDKNENNFI